MEEIVFVELLLMTPPGRHMICGQGFGRGGKEPQFVVCLPLHCTVCCKVEKSIVQFAVKLEKSIVQFVVKTQALFMP